MTTTEHLPGISRRTLIGAAAAAAQRPRAFPGPPSRPKPTP
ncbi:MAG: hypothetical protein ACLUNV_08440 [Sutterella wadsworthensis]